jgi:hypothetical protein
MQPRIIQPENMPEGAFAFCYIDEMERLEAIRQNRSFPLNPTCEYFTAIKRSGGSMEGYLGRTDRPSIYFNAPERGITYFNDLDDGKTLYFTNNGRDLFCLKHIIPGKPMLFYFEVINNYKSSIMPVYNTTIHAGDNSTIINGNNNAVNTTPQVFKNDIDSLYNALIENHVNKPDANEIIQIVTHEKPTPDGKFGSQTMNWINRMTNKAVSVAGELGVTATGGLLVEILKKFFGM